jgi:hypothetical protein
MYWIAKVCKLIYLLTVALWYGATVPATAHELDLSERADKRQLTIFSDFHSCALTGCRAGTSVSCQHLDLQLDTCVQITPSFLSFGSCVVNWPTDGRYCTTAVYSDRYCRRLITEIDPTPDEPCLSCFNAAPDPPANHYAQGAQSVKFTCQGIAVPDVTATIAPYKSDNCHNEPSLESLPTTQLDTEGCVVLQDSNQLAAGLLSFKAKMNGPVDAPTYCKIQVYSDPFCAIQVGVLDPVSGSYGRCISTFWQDVTGLGILGNTGLESTGNTGSGNTGNSALLRCYTA